MDPRVRALLEPKKVGKVNKAKSKKENEDPAMDPRQHGQFATSRQTSGHDASPANKSIPTYDPKALLNPRAANKPLKQQSPSLSPSPYLTLSQSASQSSSAKSSPRTAVSTPMFHRENSGPRSMIESLYGVEGRSERPTKRVKHGSDQEDGRIVGKGSSHVHQSSGMIGEYMRPDPDVQEITRVSKLVDLTNEEDDDDSDDDLKVIKARNIGNEKEVCFGMIHGLVQAHAVPKSQNKVNIYGDDGYYPSIKCTTTRTPSKDTVIEVHDPEGFVFGRIERELANVLAPALDNLKKFRLQPRLLTRPRKPNEQAHQPCSEKLKMVINVYGRKADVERVGRVFGRHNVWFQTPAVVDQGIETDNPHQSRVKDMLTQNRPSSKTQLLSGSRTVEEATEAVTKLFDHYANTTKPLDESEAVATVLTPLLPHQKQALSFMLQKERPRTFGNAEQENSSLWRKRPKANGAVVFEEVVTGITTKEEPDQVFGGLLADVMGLGKTLEALALIANTKEDAEEFGRQPLSRRDPSESELRVQSKATLIVAPVSTIKNWEDQISEHIKADGLQYYIYHGQNRERDPAKLGQNDVVVSTYSTIAAEYSAKNQNVASPIRSIRWFRIMLDEAHTIREPRAGQSQAMYSLYAERRWCLTGTPIQNRLDDLGSLTRFLRLYPYDTSMRFNQYVRGPAQSGDSNYLKSLRVLIDSFTLRRLKDRIDLPDRKDLVEKLKFSEDEARLHGFFKELACVQLKDMADDKKQHSVSQHHVLRAIMTLRLICDHGRELLKEKDLGKVRGGDESDAIDVDAEHGPRTITARLAHDTLSLLTEAELDMCRRCDKRISGDSPHVEAEPNEEIRGYMLPCLDIFCTECFQQTKSVVDSSEADQTIKCPYCPLEVVAQYVPIPKVTAELLDTVPEETAGQSDELYKQGTYNGPSTKVKALIDDLNEVEEESAASVLRGEPPVKSVVFSEFTSYLDLIGRALDDYGFQGCYVRIDGSMTLSKRKRVLDDLQTKDSVTILLASIKAAGQGLNLTAASRAFIMEPMWNPAAEAQAVDRIHRIGQKRKVVVKRYRMQDSIEDKIELLQRKKQKLAEISMNKNHQSLSKKEIRDEHMKEILSLFK